MKVSNCFRSFHGAEHYARIAGFISTARKNKYNIFDEIYIIFLCPPYLTGYEYQVYAAIEALKNGWIESPFMPHTEILRMMRLMDGLRKDWGVHYPFD